MDVTLRQLRAFTAILDKGSFSEAARSIRVSQASLSGLIKELEARVGATLLDRNTRNVSPSAVGVAFEPMVRRVLVALDDALDNLSSMKELRRGVIRIAAPEPLSCTFLPDLIAKFEARHPGVEVRFDDVPIESVRARLLDGSSDVGFAPAAAIADESIRSYSLYEDPLWVALRHDDVLAQGVAISWKDLGERQLINFMPHFSENILSYVPSNFHPHRWATVKRINTALSMLNVREGAVVCPLSAAPLVSGFGLKFLPLRSPAVQWKIALFARRKQLGAPSVKSFIEFARAHIRERSQKNPPRSSEPQRQGSNSNTEVAGATVRGLRQASKVKGES